VSGDGPLLDRAAEAARILEFAEDPRAERAMVDLERQHQQLHHRGEIQLAVCGILITSASIVTRFTVNELICVLLLLGSLIALVAAAVVVTGVLRMHWLTQQPGKTLDAWLVEALAARDRKARAYHRATVILFASLLCYQISIALALLATTS
jgi:hypothetical protein